MEKSLKSALQMYILLAVCNSEIFSWNTIYLILTLWLVVIYLIVPQYTHDSEDADSPKPLHLGRLLHKIKRDPHLDVIPLAFVDTIRTLLICLTP